MMRTTLLTTLAMALLIPAAAAFVPTARNPPLPEVARAAARTRTTSLPARRAGSDGPGDEKTVCVLGGGFGGLYCALSLAKLDPDVRVVLVDRSDRFVFLPLLYELAVGDADLDEVAPTFASLLAD
eukprot:CAMPEP_0194291234 /NCGR_PEP_ID=MMETSP0169-20130528/43038_1 /TAXON_ID=218684 /ORGANISM="Corethron pennatum, Strain L29A3" /LENGTH=125 /DNA_ID=CAMNT_0039039059 /DNA_START=87 /DNA_END=461 /DNA_ORIENTATION=-